MATIINSKIIDAAYAELNYNHDFRALIRFAWINDRLFLPIFFLDNDQGKAIWRIFANCEVEVYSRGALDYFVPYDWLLKKRPDSQKALETMQNIAKPFRHKLSENP
jgi:hypothetical protein